jgi:hypothetical protein
MAERRFVQNLITQLQEQDPLIHLVSGGCRKGADAFTEECGKAWGIPITIHIPNLSEGSRFIAEPYFKRNLLIARDSKDLYAFVSSDRTGGTENTIEHRIKFNLPVFLVDDNGNVYLSYDGKFPTCEPVRRLQG